MRIHVERIAEKLLIIDYGAPRDTAYRVGPRKRVKGCRRALHSGRAAGFTYSHERWDASSKHN